MKDLTKNYQKWIQGLTKDQFDVFIKQFIKVYFKIDTVVITDSKGDGGIDVKVFENKRQHKIPIQVTIDPNVYTKLEKDLVKINNHISKNGYNDVFYFFYSNSAAEDKVIKLCNKAWDDFSYKLEVFDSKALSSYIEKPEYYNLREVLRDMIGSMINEERSYFSEHDKLRFDFMSFGDETMEIKNILIESSLLQILSEGEKLIIEVEKEISKVYKIANIKLLVSKVITNLLNEDKIKFCDSTKTKLILSKEIANKIIELRKNITIQESLFANNIGNIINDYKLRTDDQTLIKKIIEIYKASYHKHSNEVRNNIENNGRETSALIGFSKFIDNISDGKKTSEISERILELCEENDFLQKICIGELFCTLVDCPEFDSYRRRNNKFTIIDTPVLLFLICAMHNQDNIYENVRFTTAVALFEYIKSNQTFIKFLTTDGYVDETSSHLFSAIKLAPFCDLDFYKLLGGSRNIFYQYYDNLKKTGLTEFSFSEFLEEEFDIRFQGLNDDQLRNYLYEYVNNLLVSNNIEVRDVYRYDLEPDYKLQFKEIKKELEKIYDNKTNPRSPKAVKYDANTLCYLYDKELDEEELIDPTIITWDNSFFNLRKRYHRLHPNAKYWHVFRPSKFLDHIALMDFKIDTKSITSEVMTVIEEFNTDIETKIRSLNDVLCQIIDLKTESGMKLTKGISEIRKQRIYKIEKYKTDDIFDINVEASQPVDKLIINLSNHYTSEKARVNFDAFKRALTDSDLVEKFLGFISVELEHYYSHQNFKKDYLQRMDTLIESLNK